MLGVGDGLGENETLGVGDVDGVVLGIMEELGDELGIIEALGDELGIMLSLGEPDGVILCDAVGLAVTLAVGDGPAIGHRSSDTCSACSDRQNLRYRPSCARKRGIDIQKLPSRDTYTQNEG